MVYKRPQRRPATLFEHEEKAGTSQEMKSTNINPGHTVRRGEVNEDRQGRLIYLMD